MNYKDLNDWIALNYPDRQSCINKCNEAVRAITNRFLELEIQVGTANGVYHCWAKDENGNIVDPTARQFDKVISYTLIANRFLHKDEIDLATGALFLRKP